MPSKPIKLPYTPYRTVPPKDGSYAVEVTKAGETVPTAVGSFATEAEADGWATNAQLTEAEHAPVRPIQRRRAPKAR